MPTTKTVDHEMDNDLAMITEPLTDVALDQLDHVLDARDALLDALGYLRAAAKRIENGTFDLAAQDLTGAALLKLADTIKSHSIAING